MLVRWPNGMLLRSISNSQTPPDVCLLQQPPDLWQLQYVIVCSKRRQILFHRRSSDCFLVFNCSDLEIAADISQTTNGFSWDHIPGEWTSEISDKWHSNRWVLELIYSLLITVTSKPWQETIMAPTEQRRTVCIWYAPTLGVTSHSRL